MYSRTSETSSVAEARIVESLHRVVDVEAVRSLGCGLDVPRFHRQAEPLGDVPREQRLARPGFSFDEQRALERDRTIDGVDQRSGNHVAIGSGELVELVVGRHSFPFFFRFLRDRPPPLAAVAR